MKKEQKELVDEIDQYIVKNFDEISTKTLRIYKSYTRTRQFCAITLTKNDIYLWFRCKWDDEYAQKYKVEDYPNKGRYPTCNIRFKVKSKQDFESVKDLLKIAFEEN